MVGINPTISRHSFFLGHLRITDIFCLSLQITIQPTTMNIEEVRAYALSLAEVTEDMPFGDDNVCFRIHGKIFLCLNLYSDEPHFAIKLQPKRSEELREQYEGVRPAWHWNKKHWSDVYYENFDAGVVMEWMRESYMLVVSRLPRKVRALYC